MYIITVRLASGKANVAMLCCDCAVWQPPASRRLAAWARAEKGLRWGTDLPKRPDDAVLQLQKPRLAVLVFVSGRGCPRA